MTAPLITPTATQINRPITSHTISIHSGSALEPHLSAGGVAHLELSITSRFVTLPAEVLHRQAKGQCSEFSLLHAHGTLTRTNWNFRLPYPYSTDPQLERASQSYPAQTLGEVGHTLFEHT